MLLLAGLGATAQETRLLRQPTMSDSEIVFVYANDLWKSPLAGGKAVRLTSDEGLESYPHFSPDGSQVAFTAQYDGNTDVYASLLCFHLHTSTNHYHHQHQNQLHFHRLLTYFLHQVL